MDPTPEDLSVDVIKQDDKVLVLFNRSVNSFTMQPRDARALAELIRKKSYADNVHTGPVRRRKS